MSTVIASLMAMIGANTSGFEKGMGRARDELGRFVKTTKTAQGGSGLGGLLGILPAGAAQFLTVAGAVTALSSALKFSIDQAAESEAVDAKLNAVLESTGGAAGLAADELNKMAESLSKVSVYDDEAIKSSEALLLTFTNIGRNVFPEAEQAILDMSSALGQDLQSSTIQLGKALNDPIAGITALSRVGVSFTQDQKDMIKVLVETGDTLGAQKLILAELNKEFGGQAAAAAATYAGQIKQLNNEMGNLGESVGNIGLEPATNAIRNTKDSVMNLTEALNTAEDNYANISKQIKIFTDATVGANNTTKSFVGFAVSQFKLLVDGVASTNPQLKMLVDLLKLTSGGVDDTAVAVNGFTGAVDENSGALGDNADAMDAQKEAVKSAENALKDYVDMLDAASQANLDMESMSRDIAEEQRQYEDDHKDAVEDVANLERELEEAREKYSADFVANAQKAGFAQKDLNDAIKKYGANSEEAFNAREKLNNIMDAKDTAFEGLDKAFAELEDAKGAVTDLEVKWHEAAQNMIYDMILVGVSAGGLLDSEQKALDEYAVKAGIKTQADIDEAHRRREIADATIAGILQSEDVLAEQKRVDAETERLTNEVTSAEKLTAAAEEKAAIDAVSTSINSATQSYIAMAAAASKVAAAARTIPSVGGSSFAPPLLGSGSKGSGGRRDNGGTGIAGTPYMIGTGAQPEMFIPSTNGTFVPNADKKGIGGVTYNIYITNPKREAVENSIRSALRNINYIGSAA